MKYIRIKDLVHRFILTRNFTLKRFLNLCLVFFQHSITKNSRVIGYPVELVIDPCNICVLHCPLCPTGQGRKDRIKGKMSFNDFKKIIDELGEYLYEIDLHNWGEPLLNEEIYDMICYAHKYDIKIDLSTTLNFFDEMKAERLIKSGLEHLIVSLSGTSQESYQRYHIGGKFNKVVEGTKKLIEMKKYLHISTPVITWRFLVMKHNECEIADARKMAVELGVDELEVLRIHGDMGYELYWNKKEMTKEVTDWLPYNERYNLDRMKPCNFLWVQAVINWNGSVSPCCAIYPEADDFGNIFEAGDFKKVWNNERYRNARKIIRQKRINDSDVENICARCLINSGYGIIEKNT